MTKEQFIEWAKSKGWSEDRYNHLQKTRGNGRTYRFKINALSTRYEVKSEAGWVRLKSQYYKNLKLVDDKLSGLTY
jgi:uncharacterized protein YaaR (DUF327 family)